MFIEPIRDDYDGPWKALLEEHLVDFLELCFPYVYKAIDWQREPIFLEQELQQIAPEESTGRQHVDKLIKVLLFDQSTTWIFIHVEVQNQYDGHFAERMFRYHTRIYDRYRQQVVSLAVLGDDRPYWMPSRFQYQLLGCAVQLDFPVVKLLAFDKQQLEQTPTLMAAFILAHRTAFETHGDPYTRLTRRIELYRRVLVGGYEAEQIRSLVRFFDWLLRLPPALAHEAHVALRAIEEEFQMPYITSHEEIGYQKGLLEGKLEGKLEGLHTGIALALEMKFGSIAEPFLPLIEQMNDPMQLEHLIDLIRRATSLAEIESAIRLYRAE